MTMVTERKILDLMRTHDLFATDTMSKPARKKWDISERKRVCNASYLDKDSKKRPRKLDYICVSNRWKSMVKSVKVKWGSSEHRLDRKFDHGLLTSSFECHVTRTGEQKRPRDLKLHISRTCPTNHDAFLTRIYESKCRMKPKHV